MKIKKELALKSFRSDLNCAQSVLTTFAEDLDLDLKTAKSVSCGFGGGMGRLQQTCGAVTGSFMVLGIYNSNRFENEKEKKDKSYAMIRSFSEKFLSLHDSLNCKELIKCDLKTEEGQNAFKQNNLSEKICEKCISNAVEILHNLIKMG